jgi:peptidyl-Lys metalloendopeptidase
MQHYWLVIYIAAVVIVANCHIQDLRIDVTPVQTRFAVVQDVKVILKFSNNGYETMGIYKWNLPENGLYDPIFEVTRNGDHVEYVGPLFKRSAPTADDVIYLAPGMTVSAVIKLSSVFDMTKTGNYMIQYKMNAGQVLATIDNELKREIMSSNDDQEFVLQSAPIMVFAAGRRNLLIEAANEANAQTRAQTATYINCTPTQSNSIRTAINQAESYANSAVQYLNAQSSGTTRYTAWFGQYSASNFMKLKSHFTKLQSTLKTKAVSFDCSCPAGNAMTYAYVYPNQHYKVYLCSAYWRAPMAGSDSQGGTIVHELAHFAVVAGTGDYAYGYANARPLAQSNPAKALMNSDSLQYFAENNPRLN